MNFTLCNNNADYKFNKANINKKTYIKLNS